MSIVAYEDSVSALAVDRIGLYLLSGSHDGWLRLWNMETHVCVKVGDFPPPSHLSCSFSVYLGSAQ